MSRSSRPPSRNRKPSREFSIDLNAFTSKLSATNTNDNYLLNGGAIILGLLAAFFLVVGVLILLGKAKDDDYEQGQNQGAWPKPRGKR